MATGAPHGLGVITKPWAGGNHSRKDEKRECHSPIPESKSQTQYEWGSATIYAPPKTH